MKSQNVIAMLHDNLLGVQVQFKDFEGKGMGKKYTYLSTDSSIEVGDDVVIDAPSTGMTIVTVCGVDGAFEPTDGIHWKWVVSKVDPTAYFERMEKLDEAAKRFEEINRKAKRESLVAAIAETLGEDKAEDLEKLIKDLND